MENIRDSFGRIPIINWKTFDVIGTIGGGIILSRITGAGIVRSTFQLFLIGEALHIVTGTETEFLKQIKKRNC